MSGSLPYQVGSASLDEVIVTADLNRRTIKIRASGKDEAEMLLQLNRELAKDPGNFFDVLVQKVMELSGANSAGISLLNEKEGRFVWPAVAGALSPHIREGTPSDFGPCGTVLEKNTSILMQRPDLYYAYLSPITPPLEEVLLIPFYVGGKAVGTIWAVMHEKGRKFQSEDKRLLEELSAFASASYKTLLDFGLLAPFLVVKKS